MVSHGVVAKVSAGTATSENLVGTGGSASKKAHSHSAGSGQEASLSPYTGLSVCGLYIFRIQWLTSSKMITLRGQGESHNFSNDLDLEITHYYYLPTLLVIQVDPISCERGLQKGIKTKR